MYGFWTIAIIFFFNKEIVILYIDIDARQNQRIQYYELLIYTLLNNDYMANFISLSVKTINMGYKKGKAVNDQC